MDVNKKGMWIITLFLAVFALAPAIAGATQAEFYLMDASPSQIVAGETMSLNLTLKNLGTTQATRVGVSLDPNDTAPIDSVGPIKIQIEEAAGGYPSSSFGAVNQAEEITLTFRVMAKANASAGTYNIPVLLEWDEMGLVSGTLDQISRTQTLYAGITILDSPFANLDIENIEPNAFSQGEQGTMTITLLNNGLEDVENIALSWSSAGDAIKPLKGTEKSFISQLQKGAEVEIPFSVIVSQNASAGIHTLTIDLTYYDSNGNRKTASFSPSINILSKTRQEVDVALAPVSVTPREQTTLNLNVFNNDPDIVHGLVLTWSTPDNVLTPLGSKDGVYIEELAPSGEIEIPLDVIANKNATPGVHTLTTDLTYYDSFGNLKSSSYSSVFNVQREPANELSVALSPISLSPGETSEIKFEISNLGPSTVEDIAIVWTAGDNAILPVKKGNKLSLKQLDAGATAEISVNVLAGASYGVYPLTVEVSYYDMFDSKHSNTLVFGAEIGGGADFQVGLQQSTGTSTSFSIGNIGVNPATSVVASVPKQEGYTVSGPSETFLGNLEPGDFSVASFEIIPRGPSQDGLQIEVSYTGTNGARQSVTSVVNMAMPGNRSTFGQNRQNKAAGNGGTNYIQLGLGALATIALLIILGKFIGRRKK
ncbi:MAG TPA: hypothetical protein ENH13_02165 [Euryarchaeota archaeon]|nr:NPCBM-associated, NEW3 domain of alpha-galactosidase [archaeon BMS3Bbin16]HDH27920.1 hypothetical protein [Euryarchaeota archaeon]